MAGLKEALYYSMTKYPYFTDSKSKKKDIKRQNSVCPGAPVNSLSSVKFSLKFIHFPPEFREMDTG